MSKRKPMPPVAPAVPLSGDQLRARLRSGSGAEKLVNVPLIGTVRMVAPSFPRLVEIRMACQDEADSRLSMVLACCPDLRPDDLQLLKTGNGIIVASLVAEAAKLAGSLTDDLVGK
ncbi:MAG: hypothetical protein RLZZ524_366 [Pseudomonadota bacterium]|jgi:hypothetical protein